MICETVRQHLLAYLDGTLEADQRVELERHLESCRTCADELASLKKLVGSLGALRHVETPPDLLAGVRARLSTEPWWKRVFAPRPIFAMPQRSLALALTAVLVVVVVAIPFYLQHAFQGASKSSQLAATSPGRSDVLYSYSRSGSASLPVESAHDRDLEDRVSVLDKSNADSLGIQLHASPRLARGAPMRPASPIPSVDKGEAIAERQTSARSLSEVKKVENPSMPQALAIEWIVADREQAMARLNDWLAQTPDAILLASEPQPTIRITASSYASLLEMLRASGEIGQEVEVLTIERQDAMTSSEFVLTPAPPAEDSSLTVELILITPSE